MFRMVYICACVTKVANLPWSGEKAECHSSAPFDQVFRLKLDNKYELIS